MKFSEMTLEEQRGYIIGAFTSAVKVGKALPRVCPRNPRGVFAYISSVSIYDEPIIRDRITLDDCTFYDMVVCEWYKAFMREDGSMKKNLWKKLWIAFDESMPNHIKEAKMNCGKARIYQLRNQGIEIIRGYLLKCQNV